VAAIDQIEDRRRREAAGRIPHRLRELAFSNPRMILKRG